MVSVVSVKVTKDLRHARCYNVLGMKRIKERSRRIKKCRRIYKAEVGHRMQIRYTPELH
jgi:ribosome-binding factor A